ncbi:MAG TPA: Rha family transcriptional regulator [Clostridiales bacterium]|nr:Rha family transcriptional regulator [Clostridiales bacterium]
MQDLVILKGKEVFTDSLIIAEGTGINHRRIKDAIRKYSDRLMRFGLLGAHQTESTGGRPEEIFDLNEEQATFLITLLKNTDKVVDFKTELVRQFYAMRRLLQEQSTEEWQFFRKEGKPVRLAETAIIKELVEYAKNRGSRGYKNLYTNYTTLANKTVGIKHVDEATIMQLNYLKLIENIFAQIIQAGMDENKDHHDIFKDCKAKAEQLNSVVAIGIAG